MRARWLSIAASAAILVGVFGMRTASAGIPGPFDSYRFQALIDSDSDDTTGCDVEAEDDNFAGPIKGIEYAVNARVVRFPTFATVVEVDLDRCVAGMFESVGEVDGNDWAVGLDNGTGGADVVEFRVPRGAIGNPSEVTLAFHATRVFLNDVLLTTNGQEGGDAIVFRLPPTEQVPLLSVTGLGLCVLLLAAVAWRTSRRRSPAMLAVATFSLLATLVTAAWAVTIMLDGDVTDWAALPPIAIDVLNDTTADDPGEDIAAAFVTADAQNLYFRMDQVNLAPVMCGNGSVEVGEDCESDINCGLDEECESCECVED